ncbi:UbiA family prenyltransferase [soil metagenome]
MSTPLPRAGPASGSTALALAESAHAGPTVAVTTITALLALTADLSTSTVVVVVAAVFTGQLTIGWANDLIDLERDRAVGRADKPIAAGQVPQALVQGALAPAALACVALSAAAGVRTALVHLGLVVAMGQAYNLGLKATVWSWLPYAVAFGALPAVVTLAADDPAVAPWWMLTAGATLGVGAHLLNALPDLADDERTGVRGLPHRLGARSSRLLAAILLGVASLAAGLGPSGAPGTLLIAGLVVAAGLLAVAVLGRGRLPFQAAMALALLDVVLLVVAR